MRLTLPIVLVFATCACETKKECPSEPQYYQDPSLEHIEALDEAWIAMKGAIQRGVTDVDAPVLATPPDGGTVAVADWTYGWEAPIAEARPPRRARDSGWGSLGRRIGSFFTLEGTAEAHGTPITGLLYMLELFVPGEECKVQVVMTATAWPVDDDTRASIHSQTAVEAELTSVYVEDNLVLPGDVPARAPERHTVTVTP